MALVHIRVWHGILCEGIPYRVGNPLICVWISQQPMECQLLVVLPLKRRNNERNLNCSKYILGCEEAVGPKRCCALKILIAPACQIMHAAFSGCHSTIRGSETVYPAIMKASMVAPGCRSEPLPCAATTSCHRGCIVQSCGAESIDAT
jgi:hypothetical protein